MKKDIIVNPDITVRKAMKMLSSSGEKCLVITDKNNKLKGTLSDGDLRKSILKGALMADSIRDIYQNNPTFMIDGEYGSSEIKKRFTKNKFDLIPVVDDQGHLKDILFWEAVFKNQSNRFKLELNVPVVIMAGGKGSRLEPFTKVLPKPLVPIHEKPIIEHIIERFTDVGINHFILSVNYKARILRAYFEELDPSFNVEFVEEQEPLGTAGSLKLLSSRLNEPFMMTNCDIIIKADYAGLYEFHMEGKYDITLVASAKEYVIPYGTCELNKDGHLSHINEKPRYDFLINTGLYVLNPEVIKLIPEKKLFHMTNLIEEAKKLDKKIGVFPIDEDSWIDIGQWSEYQKALKKL
jgi:dTDP-glucose pyrophosphorylase